jgi:hypothetical protein
MSLLWAQTYHFLYGAVQSLTTPAYPPTDLFAEQLAHVGSVVPEQVFFVHHAIHPVTDGHHIHVQLVAVGLDKGAVTFGHWLRESGVDYANHTGPLAIANADRMFRNTEVRRRHKHRLQVRDVLFQTDSDVAIGPMHLDISSVAFGQPIPRLCVEDIKIEGVKRVVSQISAGFNKATLRT